jgi:hypothetical protein
MADTEYRRFEDAEGNVWEVRPREDYKWLVAPVGEDGRTPMIVTPPPETDDPAGLDEEELRTLLEAGIPTEGISGPFPSAGES